MEELVPDLPGEDGRTVQLVDLDLLDDAAGGNPGLGAPDGLGTDRAGLVVPGNGKHRSSGKAPPLKEVGVSSRGVKQL